ncbi:MAG: serine hydrolase [bacterium]|nr:serine hydrolase [bacterium]
MHQLKRIVISIVVGIATVNCQNIFARPLPKTSPEKVGISLSVLTTVDTAIETSIANNEVRGAVLLVARKGKLVYKKAYGNRMVKPRIEKMTVDTIFDMASLTKPTATASGIMLLVQDGKLNINDKVSTYIPEFAQNGKENVTILHLLTHTSGLKPGGAYFNKQLGYDGIIRDIASMSTSYSPGTKYVYSDLGYIILGEIIRRVSGKPEHIFVAERIFNPLNMKDTGYLPPKYKWSRCAPTEFRFGKLLRGQVHDPTAWEMGGVAGHAGLFSTVDDMVIFCQMLLNGGEYHGVRIFTPESVRLMTTNQSPTPTRAWGLGWGIIARDTGQEPMLSFPKQGFGHIGWTGTAVRADLNTQTFIVLLCNRIHPDGKGNINPLLRQVCNIVGAAIIEE